MKATRPGVSGAQYPLTTIGAARTAAAGVLAAVRSERDEIARQGGPEAVGRWAAGPGEDPGEIAAHYERLQKQAAAGHQPAA